MRWLRDNLFGLIASAAMGGLFSWAIMLVGLYYVKGL